MGPFNDSPNHPSQLDYSSPSIEFGPTTSNSYGVNSWIGPAMSVLQSLFSMGTQIANRTYQERQQTLERNYYSPREQMNRFREAGINPYLALGNINSGSFGQSPQPLSDMGQIFGRSVGDALSAVQSLQQLQSNQLNLEYMHERIRQLQLSNEYSSASMGDKLKLLFSNMLSSGYVSDLRKFERDFNAWFNTQDPSLFAYTSTGGVDTWHDNLSPNQFNALAGVQYNQLRNDKVYEDYQNAITRGNYLDALVIGTKLGNSRSQIALDFEKANNMPFNNANTNPFYRLINIAINKLIDKYGDKIQQFFDSL